MTRGVSATVEQAVVFLRCLPDEISQYNMYQEALKFAISKPDVAKGLRRIGATRFWRGGTVPAKSGLVVRRASALKVILMHILMPLLHI